MVSKDSLMKIRQDVENRCLELYEQLKIDRTTEENDDYWCPIKMCICISDDCENCEEYTRKSNL